MYDSIIFDLDGTLWDATEASARGWNTALRKEGLSKYSVTVDDLKRICGLPFDECLKAVFGDFPDVDCKSLEPRIDDAEKDCLEAEGGTLFSGVASGLESLSQKYRIFLISNCQSWYLQVFLKQFELGHLFTDCDCFGDSGVPKSGMIRAMVNKHLLKHAIYIGDTEGDQKASHDAGVEFGFTRYGFGEVIGSGLTFENFDHLVNFFMEKRWSNCKV